MKTRGASHREVTTGVQDDISGLREEDSLQRGHLVGFPGVVQAVLPELLPAALLGQLDRVAARTGLAWYAIVGKKRVEGERDAEGQLAGLEHVVQLQAPREDALGPWSEAVLDEGQVEAGPVERTQPIGLVKEEHELLRVVQHGHETVVCQPREEEDPLEPRLGIAHRRASYQGLARVQPCRLEVEG